MKSVSNLMPRSLEHRAEVFSGDRLGEGTIEWSHVDEFDLVADALLGEEGVGEEHELHRCDRALDRHLDDVGDEATARPVGELLRERRRTVQGVEVVNRRSVFVAVEAFGLVPARVGARGDHELVVGETGAIGEQHRVVGGVDTIDVAEHEVDVVVEQGCGRLHDVVGVIGAERDEEIAGLVVMLALGVDHGDLPLGGRQLPAELVGGHRAGGTGSEDDEMVHDVFPIRSSSPSMMPQARQTHRDRGPDLVHSEP